MEHLRVLRHQLISLAPPLHPPHFPAQTPSESGRPAQNLIFKNIRVYWMAFIVYWGIVLFGYDTGIAGGVVSQPYFQRSFGLIDAQGNKDQKRINAVSSNVVSVLQAGAFFGALGSAPMSAYIGRKYTLTVFSVVFLVGAILTTVAEGSNGLAEIYAGRVISGIGIGAISAVAPAFVSECAPKEVRGRITGLFQIMVAIGVMISYFINYGVGINIKTGVNVWRLPFGFQLVPAGIMAFGLLTIKESPRWLASVGRRDAAIANLAYLRKEPVDSESVIHEMAEIEAAIQEEREARQGLGIKEAFFGKGNFIRFVIAFVIFLLQQWAGQNSVNYYAPQIFASIGYTGTKNSLLASGIYGVVKVVATAIFIFFGVETLGRKLSLFISAMGMGTLFFIIGAVLKTHPPPPVVSGQPPPVPPPASKAMAGLLYIYVCFYSMGWGPLPWVYVSDIFPTRTRHYGLALASSSQWLWNFVVSKVTPDMISNLQYKIFLMFATVNIGAMGTFSLLIPETKGRSLEEMDVIFGSISAEQRQADIDKLERTEHKRGDVNEKASDHADSVDRKV
ncbi:putative major facilitator superfamily, sugar transporter (TC 2.A.1.1) family protein [Lyophyllum shimeji]|uniref:Major facilitator superfamily, sugar transporter (TC 2.A.1.1) family protein n=1 Tax=Lyophyllum shimeji TaxID=47721 RepID=A0A9P3UMP8_LYOSH|nr:putative major facilitator superfamily, sugar transporter (TC 2.A.1.1) family protein [Lyophyllum shimeji]